MLQYRESLENPPLLVVCDTARLIIHTNFTATVAKVHTIALADVGTPAGLDILRRLFHRPEELRPGRTSQAVTEDAATRFGDLAQRMRERGLAPEAVARFLDRVIFCLFAEDVGLLPTGIFQRVMERVGDDSGMRARYMTDLFGAMATGGDFLLEPIPHFNGNLFDDTVALELQRDEIAVIRKAASLDWGSIDAAIFGTLFERGLDPGKRAQIGAHYTSREDVELLVDPVVIVPLRREWDEARTVIDRLLDTGRKTPVPAGQGAGRPTGAALTKALKEAYQIKSRFLQRLAQVTVLDPACGSGNFLNVALQKLKDLEKEALVYRGADGLATDFFPQVSPRQFHGIEINRCACELAQMSLWIGYLQWCRHNGFGLTDRPLLKSMTTFLNRDAVLDVSDAEDPRTPEWPSVEFIVGNLPLLGGKLLRRQLGDEYVDALFKAWDGRVRPEADLCCYWLEKARQQIEDGKRRRACGITRHARCAGRCESGHHQAHQVDRRPLFRDQRPRLDPRWSERAHLHARVRQRRRTYSDARWARRRRDSQQSFRSGGHDAGAASGEQPGSQFHGGYQGRCVRHRRVEGSRTPHASQSIGAPEQ